MKLTACGIFAICIQLSTTGLCQGITLSEKNAALEFIFSKIFEQSGYNFFYNSGTLGRAKRVSIQVRNENIVKVLDICFKDQPLEYEMQNQTIIVKEKKPELFKTIDIAGKIVNENGEPVAGATIAVKGTSILRISGTDGGFTLGAVNANSILLVSGAEIETAERRVGKDMTMSIVVKRKESELDKVMIMAYGTTTKRLNTGNIGKINSEELNRQPVSNPSAAMEGRVPGLSITQNTGIAGGSFNVQIRGRNSIGNGNEPLYIVDGVPFASKTLGSANINSPIIEAPSPFNILNPGDIESIEILKDADATAIYGSRGANGVILITTKRGKAGRTNIDINLSGGLGQITRKMDLLSGPEYLEMRREAFSNDGVMSTPLAPRSYDLFIWDTTRFTDWQKELIGGTAHYSNASLSVSGGSSQTQFLISTTYHRETTVFTGNFFDQKATVLLNMNHKSVDQKLKITLSANYLYNGGNLPSSDPTSYLSAPPNAVFKDEQGKFVFPPGISNPYVVLKQTYKANRNGIIANSTISYQVFPDLQLKTSLGYMKMKREEKQLNPLSTFNPAYGYTSGDAYFAQNSINTWIIEPQLIYSRLVGKGRLNLLAGATFQKDFSEGQSLYATGFQSDVLLENLAAAADINVLNTAYDDYRYNAFFGRIRYSHLDKYILNLSGRRDGSSRFGPDKRFANFGAAGIAWLFGRENFFYRNLSWLSYGKLRLSYGNSGNDQIGSYQYLDLWNPTPFTYQSLPGLYPVRIANPDYAWERNKKLEAALELGFLKDRILLNTSYYSNRSDNQLVGYSIPPSSGFTSIQNNLPAIVQNTGWEFELRTVNMNRSLFKWTTYINLTIPRNKLVAYPGIEASGYATTFKVGQPLSVTYAFHYTGVNPSTGTYEHVDVNNDGKITSPEDLQAIKKVEIAYYGGIENSWSFKGLTVDLFFQFIRQTNRNYLGIYVFPGYISNQPKQVLQRWRSPGDNTDVQQFTQSFSSQAFSAYNSFMRNSDKVISDGSFMRLKNISFSYQFPSFITKRIKAESLRMYMQGQNLLTFTNFSGLDPELRSISYLPPLKTIVIGLQVKL